MGADPVASGVPMAAKSCTARTTAMSRVARACPWRGSALRDAQVLGTWRPFGAGRRGMLRLVSNQNTADATGTGSPKGGLDGFFKISERGSTVEREFRGGVV